TGDQCHGVQAVLQQVLFGQVTTSGGLDEPFGPEKVALEDAVERGLQGGQNEPEHRRGDQDDDRRPAVEAEFVESGRQHEREDQHVDQAGQDPADQQRPPAPEGALQDAGHAEPPGLRGVRRKSRRYQGKRRSGYGRGTGCGDAVSGGLGVGEASAPDRARGPGGRVPAPGGGAAVSVCGGAGGLTTGPGGGAAVSVCGGAGGLMTGPGGSGAACGSGELTAGPGGGAEFGCCDSIGGPGGAGLRFGAGAADRLSGAASGWSNPGPGGR